MSDIAAGWNVIIISQWKHMGGYAVSCMSNDGLAEDLSSVEHLTKKIVTLTKQAMRVLPTSVQLKGRHNRNN